MWPRRPGTARGQVLRIGRDTAAFVADFTAAFIAVVLTATATGRLLMRNQAGITRVGGLIVLALALFLAGSLVLKLPSLNRERRPHPNLARYGPLAPTGRRHRVRIRLDTVHRTRARPVEWPFPRVTPEGCSA
jgi:cytochrome c biogenesis protein CcdA